LIFIFLRNIYLFPCRCYIFRSYGAQLWSVLLPFYEVSLLNLSITGKNFIFFFLFECKRRNLLAGTWQKFGMEIGGKAVKVKDDLCLQLYLLFNLWAPCIQLNTALQAVLIWARSVSNVKIHIRHTQLFLKNKYLIIYIIYHYFIKKNV
jgi:hypothetical protein